MSTLENRITQQIAQELNTKAHQIQAAVGLLDEGATVPFIARYRKEATGGLDDTVLRNLEERLVYLRELEERRMKVIESVRDQNKLTPELEQVLLKAPSKQNLEDLYLPYKPKRRTRAQIAREAGLEPLAQEILSGHDAKPSQLAERFLNAEAGFADIKSVLNGARDILAEQFSEQARLVAHLRNRLWKEGALRSTLHSQQKADANKFQDYFEHQEPLSRLASHRMLAMLRGRDQEVLQLKIDLPQVWEADSPRTPHPFENDIAQLSNADIHVQTDRGQFLAEVCRWTWKVKMAPSLEAELMTSLRETAEAEAIAVFGRNLKDLLLAAPAGAKATLGLDPGIRTGVKVAVVDTTGKVIDTATVYPHEPRRDWDGSIAVLAALCAKHQVSLIAIGNGTASRETERLTADLLKRHPEIKATKIMISEAGASVYSASALASAELPHLDVSLRGAVSIARRLQDPLAELVKIDPKSIGVGQYQHDVDQRKLSDKLTTIVEDCVNAVGVELNTASEALLAHVSGLTPGVAKAVVAYREENGPFSARQQLLKVPRLGAKTYEQSAGFLRIHGASNPLDQSAVHPETYKLVETMAKTVGQPLSSLMGDKQAISQIQPNQFVNDQFGLPTVQDILEELEKPGRDPRPDFQTASFDERVHTLSDLTPGMVLEGVITNVANFGAFVDIGVHQDGLVHVSALSTQFVKDPHSAVKTGQVVKVKVMDVDLKRKRIGLSMRLSDEPGQQNKRPSQSPAASTHKSKSRNTEKPNRPSTADQNNAMAQAFSKAREK